MTQYHTVVSITITRLGSEREFFLTISGKTHHSSLHSKHPFLWTWKLTIPPPNKKCHPTNTKTNYVSSQRFFARTEGRDRKSSTYVIYPCLNQIKNGNFKCYEMLRHIYYLYLLTFLWSVVPPSSASSSSRKFLDCKTDGYAPVISYAVSNGKYLLAFRRSTLQLF